MRYEDLNFKIPVESETYKQDSELVTSSIDRILDKQKEKGDNKIIKSSKFVKTGDELEIRVEDGKINVIVS